MTKAVVMAWHKYTPFGDEFYEPLLDFQLKRLDSLSDEYDQLYLVDSTWNINPQKTKAIIKKVNPHLRYYDAYKEVLPSIKQSLILFLDNDMVIYQSGIIKKAFDLLQINQYDVVSIYDTIGEKIFPELDGKSKFCPYFFATGTAMLKDYLDIDWGPNMPFYETLGKLTEKMLLEGIKPYEFLDDKISLYFDGTSDLKKGKDLGYYHIRAGSTPAYLLATKKYGNRDTYNSYLREQPKNEYLRQFAWYNYMGGDVKEILPDVDVSLVDWAKYYTEFVKFHNLP